MTAPISRPLVRLDDLAREDGLRAWSAVFDLQGEVPFRILLNDCVRLPSPWTAFAKFRDAWRVSGRVPFIRLALHHRPQVERLALRLDPVPLQRIFSGPSLEVSGRLNLAGLLGLPAREPVAEIPHLMQTLDRWAQARWGEPATYDQTQTLPRLHLYKRSDSARINLQWVQSGLSPDAQAALDVSNALFREEVADDPLIREWIAGLQKGLAHLRMGPHSWATFEHRDWVGDRVARDLFEAQWDAQAQTSDRAGEKAMAG